MSLADLSSADGIIPQFSAFYKQLFQPRVLSVTCIINK